MKISTENDNNFGYEKITFVVDNIPLSNTCNQCTDNYNFNLLDLISIFFYTQQNNHLIVLRWTCNFNHDKFLLFKKSLKIHVPKW
jgi:hypothetical protein